MNPDSTDLENRGRTAETPHESKNDNKLVWENITPGWKRSADRAAGAPKILQSALDS